MPIDAIQSNWHGQLMTCAESASDLLVVCPFIKLGVIEELLRTTSAQRISVITRVNTKNFYEGVSDLAAISLLIERGARVRALTGLHSKVYIFDHSTAIVGSANLTVAGLRENFEFGFKTTDEASVSSCIDYFDELWDLAEKDVTPELLNECERNLQRAAKAERPIFPEGLRDFGTVVPQKKVHSAPNSTIPGDVARYLADKSEAVYKHYTRLVERIVDELCVPRIERTHGSCIVHIIPEKAKQPNHFMEFRAAKSRKTGKFRYAMRFSNDGVYSDPKGLLSEASKEYGPLRKLLDFDEHTDLDYAFHLAETSYNFVKNKT